MIKRIIGYNKFNQYALRKLSAYQEQQPGAQQAVFSGCTGFSPNTVML